MDKATVFEETTAALEQLCQSLERAKQRASSPRAAARAIGKAYLRFSFDYPEIYRTVFSSNFRDMSRSRHSDRAAARARRLTYSYLAPLAVDGALLGDVQRAGLMLWAAAHGVAMLRQCGWLRSDEEAFELHEKTMSALVRGINQVHPRAVAAAAPFTPHIPNHRGNHESQ